MSISEILIAQGYQLRIVDNHLRVSPKERITPEVYKFIEANKEKILEEIRRTALPSFMTTTEDPEGSRAIHCYVPGIGRFWCVADEAVREEKRGSGLPYVLPRDLAFIIEGISKEDRFNRLRSCVLYQDPTVLEVLRTFQGSRVTSITSLPRGEEK